MKRLSVLLALLLSLSLLTTAASATFADVPQDAWYASAVRFVEQRELFNGVGDDRFAPDDTMTRGMAVTVLSRLCGISQTNLPAPPYTDLEKGSYYEIPVAWASSAGILEQGSVFRPEDPVTREQLCQWVYLYCRYWGVQLPQTVEARTFTDSSAITPYIQNAVSQCQQAGIVNGYEDNSFRPQNSTTRCEVAAMIQRLGKILLSAGHRVGTAPKDEWELILVNRWNPMPEDYISGIRLVDVGSGYQLDARAAGDFLEMMAAMRAEGLSPVINSAYRRRSTQEFLFARKVQYYQSCGYSYSSAVELAKGWVAAPGTSEHELGLAVDISMYTYDADAIHSWLAKNAWRYGFIYRYPPDKVDITGVNPEPWHYRYVGREFAKEIYESGLCLEEFLDRLP